MTVGSNHGKGTKNHSYHGRILILLGFVLSLSSLLLPFYSVEVFHQGYEPFGYSAYFWSFKGAGKVYNSIGELIHRFGLDQPFYVSWTRDVLEASSYPSVYFNTYWFNFAFNTPAFSKAVMTLFFMQLLALCTALSSLFIKSRVLKLVAVLSGLGVVALMLNVMMGDVVKRYYTTIARAGLGFWLAVFAEIVFVIGLAICTKKGSVKNSPKSTLVTDNLSSRSKSVPSSRGCSRRCIKRHTGRLRWESRYARHNVPHNTLWHNANITKLESKLRHQQRWHRQHAGYTDSDTRLQQTRVKMKMKGNWKFMRGTVLELLHEASQTALTQRVFLARSSFQIFFPSCFTSNMNGLVTRVRCSAQ